ncbi:ATP-binding protein [Humibacillus xanthopallidus]|uniref:sensor histidine kinase n=1 Tax=Humibacillus xanthopallidus TaxID=412689 RepID=UPI00384A5FF0
MSTRSPARWSVATQTFVLQVGVAVLVVAAGLAGAFVQAQRAGDIEAIARATAVAETVAATPTVIAAVQQPSPTTTLQPYAERVRVESGTDFVVIMSPQSIRFTHPDPSQIGKTFLGHTEEALAGGTVVEDYTGTLGPSLRVVKPVSDDGRVVALVAVGIRKSAVGEQVRAQLPAILLAGLVAALLSGLGTALVARRIRRQTHGLGEEQLREMYEYYDAVLHAVTEGLLITDLDGRLRLANDEAIRLLDLPPDAVGRQVGELGLAAPLAAALTDDHPHEDELHVTSARVLVLNRGPATWEGRLLGHVATLRDRTDLEELTGELDSARGLAEALRSQAHESANRLHTIVSLIELGHTDRALDFATDELAVSQVLTDRVVGSVEEPALTALLLGKAAEAHERGIAFDIAAGARWPTDVAPTRDIVTIVGNLIDNALDAVAEVDDPTGRRVTFDARLEPVAPSGGVRPGVTPQGYAVLDVSDTGPGLPPGAVDDAFRRGWSTKDQGVAGRRGIGLALVAQTVDRLGGRLTVSGPPGARFTVRLPVPEQSPGAGEADVVDERGGSNGHNGDDSGRGHPQRAATGPAPSAGLGPAAGPSGATS